MTENAREILSKSELVKSVLKIKYNPIFPQRMMVDERMKFIQSPSAKVFPFFLRHVNEVVSLKDIYEEQWPNSKASMTRVIVAIKSFNEDMIKIFPDGSVGVVRLNKEKHGSHNCIFYCRKLDSFAEIAEMVESNGFLT